MNAPLCGPQDTRFYPVLHTAQTGSTNSDVLDEAGRGTAEGFTLVADYQTNGRGRHGRTWFGDAENSLLMSTLLRPSLSVMPLMPLLVGLAVHDAVTALLADSSRVGLKWPNDVLVRHGENQREGKVAGILVESLIVGNVGAVVTGIGLNIRQPEKWPSDLLTTAVALDQVTKEPLDRQRCLHEVLTALEHWLNVLSDDGPTRILRTYRRCCTTVGRVVDYVDKDGKRISGRATEILSHGGLRLETEDGLMDISSGDVFHSGGD